MEVGNGNGGTTKDLKLKGNRGGLNARKKNLNEWTAYTGGGETRQGVEEGG